MLNNDRVVFSVAVSIDENIPYAIGYTVTNFDGHELEHGHLIIPVKLETEGVFRFQQFRAKKLDDSFKLPINAQNASIPYFKYCRNSAALVKSISTIWVKCTNKYTEVFAITDKLDQSLQINPLHGVASVLQIANIKESDYPRYENELPSDSFVNDARYLARLYITAINKLNNKTIRTEDCAGSYQLCV